MASVHNVKAINYSELCESSDLCWEPGLASRSFDGEAHILFQGKMLRLNEMATFLWECFEERATIGEVVDRVVKEFDTTRERALADALELSRALYKRKLLIAA